MLTLLRLESGEEGAGVPYGKVFWPVGWREPFGGARAEEQGGMRRGWAAASRA